SQRGFKPRLDVAQLLGALRDALFQLPAHGLKFPQGRLVGGDFPTQPLVRFPQLVEGRFLGHFAFAVSDLAARPAGALTPYTKTFAVDMFRGPHRYVRCLGTAPYKFVARAG